MKITHYPSVLLLAAALLGPGVPGARAHAFIEEAEPAVGGTVKQPPTEVHIWFTEGLKVKACRLQVFDAAGREVDKRNVHTDPKSPSQLLVSLPEGLAPGTYKVVWHAVATDTHVTQGDFTFRFEP